MVSNAPVSECHCLALPAHVKPAHWGKLPATRGAGGGVSAKAEPLSCIHMQAQKTHSLRGEVGLGPGRIVWSPEGSVGLGCGWGARCVQKEISQISSREGLWRGLAVGSQGGGGLFTVSVTLIIQGLIIRFMDSLAPCLASCFRVA